MAPLRNKKSKTSRFPVARIKKIMQMDEEVGKLASATPVMISKSLECFLQLLIDETTKQTRSRGSKKMTAHHLKQTINTLETLDFLRPIVSSVPDPAPEAQPKASSSSRKPTLDPVTGEPIPRKRASRKGKAAEEEAEEMEVPAPAGGVLPDVGMWRRDAAGGGGSGEGGRGLYDDYEDDEDDY